MGRKLKVSKYVADKLSQCKFEAEYCRSGGKGGQNVNKVNSACRVTETTTGLAVKAQDTRDAPVNKSLAFNRLVDKLIAQFQEEEFKLNQNYKELSTAIRSYKEKDGIVKDHRTGKTYHLDQILNGRLDQILHDCKELLRDRLE